MSRTYVDFADWDEPGPTVYFATCGHCGWDSPRTYDSHDEANRARWRHPTAWCWLRALWLDHRPALSAGSPKEPK